MSGVTKYIAMIDTQTLEAVVSGSIDLNAMAEEELASRLGHGIQLELDFEDVPMLLQQQAW